MTLPSALALFLIMAALAAIPSSSVALVVIRSAGLGLRNGVAAALGIALGDLAFVVLAIAGLTALSEMMGALFALLRYLGAAYLIWLGIGLIRGGSPAATWNRAHRRGGIGMSFIAGFVLTLGDVKAILFYAALFPTVVDVPTLAPLGMVAIAAITLVTVGGVKIVYAIAAQAIAHRASTLPLAKPTRIAGGGLMVGVGGWLIAKG